MANAVLQQKGVDKMPERIVHLVGRNSLQNELFVSFLEKETGLTITSTQSLGDVPIAEYGLEAKHLILFDCMGMSIDNIWTRLGIGTELNPSQR